MVKNVGKRFESNFKSSLPNYVKVTRIPDPPQSFTQRSDTKFSKKNPYDFECFDSKNRLEYCLELKTTSQKYMTYDVSEEDAKDSTNMIKWHQIEGLTKASEYPYVTAGFMLNFRLDNGEELLYFLNINDFNRMRQSINKKSFNIMDVSLYGGIRINGGKLKVNYRWNLDEFLESQSKQFN